MITEKKYLKAKSIVFSYKSKIIDNIKCNHSYDKLKISMAKALRQMKWLKLLVLYKIQTKFKP